MGEALSKSIQDYPKCIHALRGGERAACQVRTLVYSWDAVHEEACRLEHAISGTFEQRIAKSLGNLRRDPPGAPIPTAGLVLEAENDTPLGSLSEGVRAVVSRIVCKDAGCLRRLEAQGFLPGATVAVLARSSGGRVTVSIDGSPQPCSGPR
jgi:DtxR family Mn-dependent transcriptional regulator